MSNAPKKSVAEYLEEREKAKQVKSIKDYFGKVPNTGSVNVTASTNADRSNAPTNNNKRMVEVWKGGRLGP